jgi:hypothetical protein
MKVLSERRALVTGGSRGIGAAIVPRLAADGPRWFWWIEPESETPPAHCGQGRSASTSSERDRGGGHARPPRWACRPLPSRWCWIEATRCYGALEADVAGSRTRVVKRCSLVPLSVVHRWSSNTRKVMFTSTNLQRGYEQRNRQRPDRSR